MCLPRYRRMPGGKYKGRYHDYEGADLMLVLGLGLCLWVAPIVGIVVGILSQSITQGLVAALGGFIFGLILTSVPLHKWDIAWMRLGPPIWAWYAVRPFLASAVAIIWGVAVL
jgi:hypothetical protein